MPPTVSNKDIIVVPCGVGFEAAYYHPPWQERGTGGGQSLLYKTCTYPAPSPLFQKAL